MMSTLQLPPGAVGVAANATTDFLTPTHRPRQPSLIPNMEDFGRDGGVLVEIVKQGWLNKQGGAKGGRKSWKRRWFVLKEDCLYYKESPESLVLLGVMPLHGCHILDLGCLTQSAPPPHNETQTVCHECKKPFTFLERKHHCRHWSGNKSTHYEKVGNTFCNNDSTKRIAIPKFGFHSRVRVCDSCYETVAAELESSEVVLKLLELTGEKPAAEDAASSSTLPAASPTTTKVPSRQSTIAAHAQAMEQIKHRAAIEKAAAAEKRASTVRGLPPGAEDKKKFTLPSVNKPHLFALKNSERELWLHAENQETRLEWVSAIRSVQKRKSQMLRTPGGAGKDGEDGPLKPDAPSWEIDYSAITVLNKVGVGAFGEVFRARLWGTEVACKTLKTEQFKDAASLLEDLKKEVSILSGLRHPNVVLYIGACTTPPNVCIMTEWCSRGSLYDVLHDYSIHLPAKLCIDLAMGIAQGMNYLHSLEKKIIHRDLKSHNILVNKAFQVKVADFGLSHVRELHSKAGSDTDKDGKIKHHGPRHYGIFGTPEFMAPEVMEGSVYTEKIDVYSFGILLSELVTRQMPFHDQFKITSYMDVVDAVLDQGAIPTIPAWCENLLGGLIRACLNRNPSERPNFNDLILRLREVADLDDSIYFFAFDLPRLRELMMSPNPGIQSLAGSEVAALLSDAHVRRRSTPAEALATGSASPNLSYQPSPSTASSSSEGSIATSPLPPLTPLVLSPATAGAVTVGGLTSPLQVGPSTSSNPRQPHVDGDYWILSNEDAFDFLERFTQLLSSSHREVQLHSCRALLSLLRLSSSDRIKRAQDRELVITCGGLGALLALLLSEQAELSSAAGQVLLILTEDLTPAEQSAFVGLNQQGLAQLHAIVGADIAADEHALIELQQRIDRKREILGVVQACAKAVPSSSSSTGMGSPNLTPLKPKKRGGKRTSMIPRFQPGGSPISPLIVHEGDEDTDCDGDDHHMMINRHPLLNTHTDGESTTTTGDTMTTTNTNTTTTGATDWGGLGSGSGTDHEQEHDGLTIGAGGEVMMATRGRSETAQAPTSKTPTTSSMAIPPSAHVPSSPELLTLFQKVNELVEKNAPIPEKFSEMYYNIVLSSYMLRYDLEGDSWHICYGLLLPDELRVFHDTRDEPDEPIMIIRTRARDPDSDTMEMLPAKVRVGLKHGMPSCFQIEDYGRIFTFCSGSAAQQEKWRAAITGKPMPGASGEAEVKDGTGSSTMVAPVSTSAHPLPAFSISVPPPPATLPLGDADSPDLHATPMLAAPDDPTLGKDIPHLELPTPPFAKRYRDITFHGYLMIRDRNTQAWVLKYALLVGTTLRVFDSHRSSPNDPWAEHEIDTDYVNVNASERRTTRLGANEFFIRLHSSSVQFDCWADSPQEKAKWIQALGGERFGSLGAALTATNAGLIPGSSSSSSSTTVGASRIQAFASYYGHIDYFGFLYRKRKLTNRWMREFVCLVDSEVHYYSSPNDPVDQPAGTFYIATNSGKAFHVKQSSKRPHCIGVINPSRTFYLAAEVSHRYTTSNRLTEKDYLGWVNAIHQNLKRLSERHKMQKAIRQSMSQKSR